MFLMLFLLLYAFASTPVELAAASQAAPQEICITFDDFPMGKSAIYGKKEKAEIYYNKLKALGVQAAFFCIGEQAATKEGTECLCLMQDDHILANHSYHHRHFSKMGIADFQEELETTESLLSNFDHFKKWFRFPYLD